MELSSVMKKKKGQVNSLAPAVLALTFAGIVLVFGVIIFGELLSTSAISGGDADNTTLYVGANATLTGLATFADFWEIIVLAVVISVVIGLLLVVFGGRTSR